MKSIAGILFLYITFLTVQPGVGYLCNTCLNHTTKVCYGNCCCEQHAHTLNKSATNPGKNSHKSICNPFEPCASCIVFSEKLSGFVFITRAYVVLKPATDNLTAPGFSTDCFHPPKCA